MVLSTWELEFSLFIIIYDDEQFMIIQDWSVRGGRPSQHDSQVCAIQKIRILKIKFKENSSWSKCQNFLDSQILYRIVLLLRILNKVYFQRSDFWKILCIDIT